jgi:hypothetical protein
MFLSGTVHYYSERNKASKKSLQGHLVDCKLLLKNAFAVQINYDISLLLRYIL